MITKKKLLYFGLMSFLFINLKICAESRLLIKLPTRARPVKFFQTLDKFYEKLSKTIPFHFVVTCDSDDTTMNNEAIIHKLNGYQNLSFHFGTNSSKVAAYNADINSHLDFDVLLVVSDDMEPVVQNFDVQIMQKMQENFPDFDGVLNFHDGYIGAECNTLPIIGRKFYDRFGYIYNPDYKSLYCDEELTLVSKMLGKEAVFKDVIIKHNHPIWNNQCSFDDLYKHNDSFYAVDKDMFWTRRQRNFDLTEDAIKQVINKDWSILICTLETRKEKFNFIYNKLIKQIKDLALEDKVEVLYFSDNKEYSVGFKRNSLLRRSRGSYVCYVDDDDDVHDNYIKVIHECILKKPDCIGLTGIITFNGKRPKKFIHSLKYNTWFEKENVYYRPPNHLNTIKRSIAIQFLFPEKSYGEDADWSMQMVKSGLLKVEEEVVDPYYFYLFAG